jgi:molecular chaperone HscB
MFRALTCARRVQPTLVPALASGRRYLSKGLYKDCPSCGAPLPTLLPACPKCRFIASIPQEVPRHEVFNLDYSNPFEVDEGNTKNTFRRLQKVVHPDLWSASDKVRIHDMSLVSQLLKSSSKIGHYNSLHT